MFLIKNLLVGALAGAFLGLLVALLSIPAAMHVGMSGNTLFTTIGILAAITAIVGAICGAILQLLFALVVPGTSPWKIARYALIGGFVGLIISGYVAGFVRPGWWTDGGLIGAILGSSVAIAVLRRARQDETP
jgi:hypothetical protein